MSLPAHRDWVILRRAGFMVASGACLVVLAGCGHGGRPAEQRVSAWPTSTSEHSENVRAVVMRARRENVRAVVMRATRELAELNCAELDKQLLLERIGLGFIEPTDDTYANYVALGYARDLPLRPIPLQRAAYNGCVEGVEASR